MWYTAFILGLLGSFHCIGMCGPIALLLPVDRSNSLKKVSQIALYHIGRLLSYGIIGFVFGLLGRSFYLFGMQQYLSIVLGVLMIIGILMPFHNFGKHKISQPIFKIISKIKSSLGDALKKKSPDTFLTIGFLNGFLPCGLVYIAVFGAIATGEVVDSVGYMVAFGLGTASLMSLVIYFSSLMTVKVRTYIRKLIPVFVVIIGVLFILRGLGLGIPYVSPQLEAREVTSNIECH